MKPVLIFLLYVYRWVVSPFLRALAGEPTCRFTPSCSQYALEAIERHGAVRGSALTFKRLCRCHPWGDAGHDPVPACLKVTPHG